MRGEGERGGRRRRTSTRCEHGTKALLRSNPHDEGEKFGEQKRYSTRCIFEPFLGVRCRRRRRSDFQGQESDGGLLLQL